jgi:hypothetical protein
MGLQGSRLAALGALLLWSCSHTTPPPLRGVEGAAPPMRLDLLENRTPIAGLTDCPDKLLRGRSIERFVDDGGKEFDVGVIELSDDGHVSDFEQEEQVFRHLREFAVNGNGAVIVTFVHGWHHGGKVCDNNMACFRRVLQALSQSDPRPVMGVYIGWHGESLHGNASVLTFYGRKRTAQLVGHEGGRQVLLKLDALYRELNASIHNPDTPHPVIMVTAGHSFGGALVYSAVEGALVGEVRNIGEDAKGSMDAVGKRAAKCGIRPVRSGIGDLVVLVNPAFEARRYDRFAEDLTTPGKYAANQLPVMLTIASEGDSAVKVAFPAGRILYFSLLPWRYRGLSDIIGAGHYDPQTTHDLVVEDDSGKEIHPGPLEAKEPERANKDTEARCNLRLEGGHDYATCACEYPVPSNLAAAINPPAGAPKMTLAGGAVNTTAGERIALKSRTGNWDPHAPFIVARAVPDIISQHSDIYTPRFVTFLTAYISEFLKAARNVDPNAADDDPCRAGP